MSDWANVAVVVALGIAGLSVFLKTRLEIAASVAEARLRAYAELWAKTQDAAPMATLVGEAPPGGAARRALYDALTSWYFTSGNGMLLPEPSRSIYLTAKRNLVCAPEDFEPAGILDRLAGAELERERGTLSVRQLSLLRTSLRADLGVYAGPWGSGLSETDKAFLRACGVRLWRRPWRRPLLRRRPASELPAGTAVPAAPAR